jgi:ABC-type glycerol-3-phosphate transport system permease component
VNCTNTDTGGGAIHLSAAVNGESSLSVSECEFANCVTQLGPGGAVFARGCVLAQFSSNCFLRCKSRVSAHCFHFHGLSESPVRFALNSLHRNGDDNHPKVFDLQNLSFHFSDTNVSRNIASYAHSLAGRSIHILSLSFCNFVRNEGGSGFLTLGGSDEKVLFENANVFENTCRDDHQLFRVHSRLTVKHFFFADNSGRVLAQVDRGSSIWFVGCAFSVPQRLLLIGNSNGTKPIPAELLTRCRFEASPAPIPLRLVSPPACFFAVFTETARDRSFASMTVNSAVIAVPVLLVIASLSFWLGLTFAKYHFHPGRAAIRL